MRKILTQFRERSAEQDIRRQVRIAPAGGEADILDTSDRSGPECRELVEIWPERP